MSTRMSTVYKYIKEHCPISKVHRDAREQQVENPGLNDDCLITKYLISSINPTSASAYTLAYCLVDKHHLYNLLVLFITRVASCIFYSNKYSTQTKNGYSSKRVSAITWSTSLVLYKQKVIEPYI
jgi:hypothetical protein